jgi:YesN/AraC family two-component response regulator
MLRALIVDDEPAGRDRLHDLLTKHRDVEVVAESADVPSALAAMREATPDVVFLDVQMPGANGFRLIDEVGTRAMPAVVFVTAHEEHALRAFEVEAVDYLLKPFDEDRFSAALARVREEVADRSRRNGPRRAIERLPLRTAGARELPQDRGHRVGRRGAQLRAHPHRRRQDARRPRSDQRARNAARSRPVPAHPPLDDHQRRLRPRARAHDLRQLHRDPELGQRLTVSRSFRDRLPVLLGA